MLRGITNFFDRMVQRFLPDAFLFAIILTLVVFGLGIFFTGSSPGQMVQFWGDGFWNLLAFAMQMSLIVVTGYILANTPLVKAALSKISTLAKTPGQAIVLVTFVAGVACVINYGFGLVAGALLAVHVARRVPNVDYRLLMASAYSGFILWHGGFSGSIPLTIATEDHFLSDSIGSIAITETLFSSMNIFIIVTLLLSLPLLNLWLLKSSGDLSKNNLDFLENEDKAEQQMAATTADLTPAERMENSRIISYLIGALGLAFIVYHFIRNGFDLNINIVNFIFLFLGILFHQTPRRFLNSVNDGVKNAGGIIIQFPFYAGIMGMMVASGLSEQMSNWFVSISTEFTFPVLAFISAGIVNFFVPSGGGQWAVQAPIMIPAAMDLGVSTAKTAMAVAWGDAWTNMIQPFWALPLLAIAGLKVKDIMGFCVIILIWSFIPISIALLFFN
ncbi:short-chain fatty acid transporter [Halobacillus sp. GSS1]|uniref:short-chain fatty acid transporter n=1 Tax=unclassified Halobacillus TaxID=2636472 RepID=UPI001A8D1B51|nr:MULTISPECIES: short-chain fatty acid transporter [unclassified Halobacillus]MBN9654922.1 short-chain fatty acid transporter [Halobacillus sp. GSS1]MEC3885616.1 short-chain fatty acid transporter [Halobacillus sp. HZG1]